MVAPSNGAFLAAQSGDSSGPKLSLKALLRNIAHWAEGGVASSSGDFSSDFPAAGANDGDATHLSYGPAATAENQDGGSGWKSDSAKTEDIKTTAAHWEAGTKSGIEAVAAYPGEAGNAVALAHGTSYYQQDFNLLTEGAALVGQDSWTAVSSAGTAATILTMAAAGYDGKGVRLRATINGANRRIRRNFAGAAPTPAEVSFRLYRESLGTGAANSDAFELRLANGAGTSMYGLRFVADGQVFIYDGTSYVRPVVSPTFKRRTWSRVVIAWSGAIGAASVRVFLDGYEFHRQEAVNLTGIANADLFIQRTSVTTEFWLDELRIGSGLATSGTQDTVADLTAATIENVRALLSFNGTTDRTESIIPGGFYSMANQNTYTNLRTATSNDKIGQTFTLDADGLICAVELTLRAPSDNPQLLPIMSNMWCEIHPTSAGLPTATVLARSSKFPFVRDDLPGGFVRFKFQIPFSAVGGEVYALVILGDWGVGPSAIRIASDSSGVYAGGSLVTYSSATGLWTASAGIDLCFSLLSWLQSEAGYGIANQDGHFGLRNALVGGEQGGDIASQVFEVPYDTRVQHFQVNVKRHAAGVLAAGSYIWAELWSTVDQGGTLVPDELLVDGLRLDATVVDWSTYKPMTLSLNRSYVLEEGVSYALVIQGNWADHAANHLDLALDISAPTYADGVFSTGEDPAGSVWAPATWDLIFEVLGEVVPRARVEVAYSADNISYSSFAKVTDNPEREGSMTDVEFTGQALRYWKIRSQLIRASTGGVDAPPGVELRDLTLKVVYRTAKNLSIDFGTARTIGGLEIYGHPTEGGIKRIKVQLDQGAGFVDFNEYGSGDGDLLARKTGGSAIVTNASGVLTTDGTYLRLLFAANETGVEAVRVVVLESEDEYARILELRAFRVEDWSDRVIDFTVAQHSDPIRRRIEGRTLEMPLRNDDYFLSPKRSESGYGDQLGDGVRFILAAGYRDGATLIRQGVFYVDKWPEKSDDPTIQIRATDGSRLMSNDVQTRFKSHFKCHRIIEYLGNLAGIPSQDMILSPTSNVVEYFAPVSVNAYQEAQKVAEACTFSPLYFDRDGYLVFRPTGSSSGKLGTDAFWPEMNNLFGPPAFLDGKVYSYGYAKPLVQGEPFTGERESRLLEYDPDTDLFASSQLGLFLSANNAGFSQDVFNGYPVAFGDSVFVLNTLLGRNQMPNIFTGQILNLTQLCSLWKWNGTTTNIRSAYEGPFSNDLPEDFERVSGLNAIPIPVSGALADTKIDDSSLGAFFLVRERLFFSISHLSWKNSLWEINLATGEDVLISGPGANKIIQAGCYESGHAVVLTQDTSTGDCEAWTLNPDTRAFTLRATLASGPSINVPMGAAGDGEGFIWTTVGKSNALYDAKLLKLNTATWTFETMDTAFTDGKVSRFSDADSVAVGDGYVLAGAGKPARSGSGILKTMIARDEKDYVVATSDIGSIGLGSCQTNSFRSVIRDGVHFIYGLMDGVRMFEFQIRKTPATQEATVKDIHGRPGGIYVRGTLDHGAEDQGKRQLYNMAVVKSAPLVQFDEEVVWTADGLPWGVINGAHIRFQAELSGPCLPGTTLDIVSTPAGIATGQTTEEIQVPEVTMDITGAGKITSVRILRSPLRKAASSLAIAFGEPTSINRHGLVRFPLENDYIYSGISLLAIAKSIVSRFGQPKARFTQADCFVLWDLDPLDLLDVIDDRTGVDGAFVTTGFSNNFRSQMCQLQLVEL